MRSVWTQRGKVLQLNHTFEQETLHLPWISHFCHCNTTNKHTDTVFFGCHLLPPELRSPAGWCKILGPDLLWNLKCRFCSPIGRCCFPVGLCSLAPGPRTRPHRVMISEGSYLHVGEMTFHFHNMWGFPGVKYKVYRSSAWTFSQVYEHLYSKHFPFYCRQNVKEERLAGDSSTELKCLVFQLAAC